MGGTGSGRFGDGATCDNHSRLDVRFLHRRLNALRATPTGRFLPGVLSWHCGGVPRGRAGFSCAPDPAAPARAGAIGLAWSWRWAGEERWRDDTARVAVEWTPCRYGGHRPWWRCPRCASRRAVLYLVYGSAGSTFLCRSCAGLSYQSQRENEHGRALLKAFAVRERLGQKEGGCASRSRRSRRGCTGGPTTGSGCGGGWRRRGSGACWEPGSKRKRPRARAASRRRFREKYGEEYGGGQ